MDKTVLEHLESKGTEAVLLEIALGAYGEEGSRTRSEVEAWLNSKRDAREKESLSIARKALDNSRLATRIAISAIVLSIIMAIYEIIKWYSSK